MGDVPQLEEIAAMERYLATEIPALFSERPGDVSWRMESIFPLGGPVEPVELHAQFYTVRLEPSGRTVYAACGRVNGFPYEIRAVFETQEQLGAYVRGAAELLAQ